MTPADRISAARARTKAREDAEREERTRALKAKQTKLRALTKALGVLQKGKP